MNLKSVIAALLLCAAFAAEGADSRAEKFNDGWRFALADSAQFSAPGYSDGHWRALRLPHDWAIEGEFSDKNPSGTGGGALPGGVGWYRKSFTVSPADLAGQVFADFDGAYMNSTVYINGHSLGTRPYGYASYTHNLTPYLHPGENVIAVRVDNAEQPNSRWYSGCGIYRNVWLRKVASVHIPLWGQFVNPEVTADKAAVKVTTDLDNLSRSNTKVNIAYTLTDASGRTVATAESLKVAVGKGKSAKAEAALAVAKPHLWSVDDPYLYTLTTKVTDSRTGAAIDTYTLPVGLRYFNFDAKSGFSLNGKPMPLRGVCMHHDLGALGAAVNVRAMQRQIEILKAMGVNALRCSHNPPAPEMLELCDRMGLVVMDEAFDMWRKKKTKHDYARYFPEWHERDLSDQLKRDRNHPSIMMWSIGNEVLEQWTDVRADTLSLEEANMLLNFGHSASQLASEKDGKMSVNSLLTKKLVDMVHSLHPGIPVTAGCNEPKPGNHLYKSGALDIIGYNYHVAQIDSVPKWFPGKPFLISESNSALMTRGYYKMPSDSSFRCPKRWDLPFEDSSFACSSYDNYRAPWGSHHEVTMRYCDTRPFIAGQFIWTGFDYIGEPTPYPWPARSSYFGIVDLAGIPKDVYYMYQSQWCPERTVLHVFPHWNWTEGEIVDVWAYYNNADEVELYLNGESLGARSKPDGKYHVMWRVPFTPGTLRAVSRKAGQTVAVREIHTAGTPAKIRLTPDRTAITPDGEDLSYVLVEILDKDGNLCPLAENEVTFTLGGPGEIAGVDNGSPVSLESFKASKRKAFYGKAMAIIRSTGTPGAVTLTATSPGLAPFTTTVNCQ